MLYLTHDDASLITRFYLKLKLSFQVVCCVICGDSYFFKKLLFVLQ